MFDHKTFRFNKQFGQNFLTDVNLLDAIVSDAGVTDSDIVLEIGAGAGALTEAIARKAKRVVAYEIDRRLEEPLRERFRDYPNVEIVIGDFMKVTDEELTERLGADYKVIANLPYYVTSPIVMRFVEGRGARSVTVMVQKEVGLRFTALPNTADYGAITVAIALRGRARITRNVSRKLFCPVPDVDSCVVSIDMVTEHSDEDVKRAMRLVKAGFAMRRKTLVNNISAGFGIAKARAEALLVTAGLDPKVRGEVLSPDDYMKLMRIMVSENVYR